ncbi:MAG TPA: rhomboid family intramembrane serine protease [Bacteroidales bacterium]|nr:rhomboid family intramembrane serine protease [Bacteroidales bacterium]HPS16750.1 rhomboid family intramembrane serine protease [Bacteroidales bacterium]
MLSRLILINVIVYILANISSLILSLYQIPHTHSLFTDWFAVPSNPESLLQKPWTIFTYMFLHEDFMHILFNMIMLYFGGSLFQQFLGGKKLLTTYILGGIAGAAVYILAFNYFPMFSEITKTSMALGASASVLAILVAIAVYIPDYSVILFLFGKIKMKYIAMALVLMDILSIEKENPGGHIAHLGGALWGFIYILSIRKNKNLFLFLNPVKKFFTNIFKPKPKLRVEYKKQRPVNDDEYNRIRAEKQQKIDAILDKISKNGYDSLTKEEKEFLFSTSNKN